MVLLIIILRTTNSKPKYPKVYFLTINILHFASKKNIRYYNIHIDILFKLKHWETESAKCENKKTKLLSLYIGHKFKIKHETNLRVTILIKIILIK